MNKLLLGLILTVLQTQAISSETKVLVGRTNEGNVYEILGRPPTYPPVKYFLIPQVTGTSMEVEWNSWSDKRMEERTKTVREDAIKRLPESTRNDSKYMADLLASDTMQTGWRNQAWEQIQKEGPGPFLTQAYSGFQDAKNGTSFGIDALSFGKPPFQDEVDKSIREDFEKNRSAYRSLDTKYLISCYDFLNEYKWPGFNDAIRNPENMAWQGAFKGTDFPGLGNGAAIVSHTIIQNIKTGVTTSLGRERMFFSQIGTSCTPIKSSGNGSSSENPNAVPADSNGQVASGKILNADGTLNLMEGLPTNVSGGPINRAYNGVSGSISGEVMSPEKLKVTQLNLNAILYGMGQIVPKHCKAVGKTLPLSVSLFKTGVKNYFAAEKMRDELLRARIEKLKGSISSNATSIDGSEASQLKAIEFQLESVNLQIDSLSGSSLFSKDNKASEARASARIPWRENLLSIVIDSSLNAETEHSKTLSALKSCTNNVKLSIAASVEACKRTKTIVKECPEGMMCTKEAQIVPDPVPGSCEMANSYLPLLQKGPIADLHKLYSVKKIPSEELNKKFLRINTYLNTTVTAFPVSNDQKYDWTTPLESCKDPKVAKVIRDNGVACQATHIDADVDTKEFENIGNSNDPLMQLGHYTLGTQLNAVEYEFLNRRYQDSIASGKKPDEAMEAIKTYIIFESVRGPAFLNNTDYDREADAKLHLKLAGEYGMQGVNKCTSANPCNSFPGSRENEPNFEFQTKPSEIKGDIMSFLQAVGVAESDVAESIDFFNKNWNKDDLIIGQSNIRLDYYKKVRPIIEDMIQNDRNQLAEALEQRSKLLGYYNKLKNLYQISNGVAAKPSSTNQTNTTGSRNIIANTVGNSQGNEVEVKLGTNKVFTTQDNKGASFSNNIGANSNDRLTLSSAIGSANIRDQRSGSNSIGKNSIANYSSVPNINIKKMEAQLSKIHSRNNDVIANSDEFNDVINSQTKSTVISKNRNDIITARSEELASLSPALSRTSDALENAYSKNSSYSKASDYYSNSSSGSHYSNLRPQTRISSTGTNETQSKINPVKDQSHLQKNMKGNKNSVGSRDENLEYDKEKIKNAIIAKKFKAKDHYDSNESDSIFQKVTKAYVRNLEKVELGE